MNLSERLDAARRQRSFGLAPDLQEEGYVLRGAVEQRTYDGTDLRSGEEMDPDKWEQVRSQRAGMELPRLGDEEPEEEEEPRNPVSAFLEQFDDLIGATDDEPEVDLRADESLDLRAEEPQPEKRDLFAS